MLEENGIAHSYREYRKQPLSAEELRQVLSWLGMEPRDVLRRRDKAFKALGLTGDEDAETLIDHMANHPTLLQRPIGVLDGKARVGRPVENLLELVSSA